MKMTNNTAMSAGPGMVNLITDSERLKKMTKIVVVYLEPFILAVYRESVDAPGKYSYEEHRLINGEFTHKKDGDKYCHAPMPPQGSIESLIDGIPIWSHNKLSANEYNVLEQYILELSSKPK